jgi:hypothetical protein
MITEKISDSMYYAGLYSFLFNCMSESLGECRYIEVEHCFTFPSDIYGCVETDDYNDEVDKTPDLHFKDRGSFTLHIT